VPTAAADRACAAAARREAAAPCAAVVLALLGLLWLLGACASAPPRRYTAPYRTIQVDGQLEEWEAIPWTEDFVDIEGEARPAPRFRTRAKLAWDERFFYFAFELEEPQLQASFTQRDSFIFQRDDDIEIFLDPDGDRRNYFELELNAHNTPWDLFLVRTYQEGGPALHGYDMPGLRSAVALRGTLNDGTDVDQGWSAEIAIPWAAFADVAARPEPGDSWRVNFSRVEWDFRWRDGRYEQPPREDNWVWSPQGAVDMHRPERWGIVDFAR
jgi:hypothetical protein